jgi:predicted nucleotidyltransferase
MTRKRQPTEETLRQCMRKIVAALENRGRRYYFFGGVSCQLLAKTPRTTADVDLVIENSSNTLPDPRDWLADEPFFWSGRHSQYVWVTMLEDDDD